jgi:Zn-dependent protease
VTIARVGGIPIRVDPTWLIAFLVVTWSLGQGLFPAEHPGWSPATYWVAGATGALLLFGSVLVHELSHAAVARRIGLSVGGITLFVFGGVATVDEEATRPRDELLMAAAGPATSLLLAGAAWLAAGLAAPLHEPSAAVLGYVALANASLALFNLLPGFPLDGGRVLRAALWARGRDRRGATRTAGRLGEAMAVMLIILGVADVVGGDPVSGLWVAFVGWFLRGAAIAELRGSDLADAILRHAPAPVLLVTPRVTADWPHGRAAHVLVALDGSAFAEEAVGPAFELAGTLGADLHLFRVVVPPPPPYAPPPGVPYYRAEEYFEPEKELAEARAYLCRLAERRRPDGPVVTVGTAMGDPAATIADLVREKRFDVVVLATHGRGGVSRLLMGSVATALVGRSTAPLLAVRPEALRRGRSASPAESVVSPDPAARPAP